MEINIDLLKQAALNAKKSNKKLLQRLKKKPQSFIDSTIHDLHHQAFEEIDCLKCANCCKTTGPLFTSKDIERISKHLRLKPQQFIEQYLRIDEDEDYVLQNVPCTFLDSENYCSIYEVRPKACREYPHTDRVKQSQLFNLTLKNAEICPAVFNMFDELKKMNI